MTTTNILKSWLNENGFDDIKVRKTTGFYAWVDDKKIGYTCKPDDKDDKLFYKNARHLGLAYNCSSFVLSIFHEIGHIKMDNTLTKQEMYKCEQAIKKIEDCYEITSSGMLEYFNLPNEKNATLYAIDYINNHKSEILKLMKNLKKYQ